VCFRGCERLERSGVCLRGCERLERSGVVVVPRDSTATRARLLTEAERLFAEVGIYQVTVREIVDAAGQKNPSALSYHFGSREGVLDELLKRHGGPIDLHRGELMAALDESSPTASIIDALVRPMTERLASQSGRNYLRIVVQLSSQFSMPRSENQYLPEHISWALSVLDTRPAGLSETIRKERVGAMVTLMTASLAARAVEVQNRRNPALSGVEYTTNLTDMLVGIIEAPASISVT
jgi:AcrR family transcriptional regulator